jgi:hypothetical protein
MTSMSNDVYVVYVAHDHYSYNSYALSIRLLPLTVERQLTSGSVVGVGLVS